MCRRATVRELLAFSSGVAATLGWLTLLTGHGGIIPSPPSIQSPILTVDPPREMSTLSIETTTRVDGGHRPPRTTLERSIDQLEKLTVKRSWTSMVLGQVKAFREKREAFGNKADFAGMAAVMRYYAKHDKCSNPNPTTEDGPAVVLLAGANKGDSTSQVLRECGKARMHIFEIQKLYEIQAKRFKDSKFVTVHRKGWSDQVQKMQITMPRDSHELAGLYSPVGKWKNALQLNETVETIPLADFIAQEALERISYVIIDVEGKEPNVLRGMKLELHQRNFPVFQLELGGTWTDSRHDEDQWGQYAVAMYLTALGYKLFLMGEKNGGLPLLLQVEPEFFRIVSFRPEVDVGGNLLALHPEFADVGLLEYLQSFVLVAPAVQNL